MTPEAQEKNTERAAVAVTLTEKRKLDWLADTLELRGEMEKNGGVSQLLRRYSVRDAIALADELSAKLSGSAA